MLIPLLLLLNLSVANAERTPVQFLDSQVSNLVQTIDGRPTDDPNFYKAHEINISATRNDLRNWLYQQSFIEASDVTLFFSDKLLMGKILHHYLKEKGPEFHPFVMGLKEFLEKAELVDENGVITANADQIRLATKKYFPEGFIMKPPVSWATDGKGFYAKEEEVIALLARADPKLYEAKEFFVPFKSPLAIRVTSGERWMMMGKIKNTSISENKNYGLSSEFRVHTFGHYVIPNATLHRYGLEDEDARFFIINDFAMRLLKALPRQLTLHQVWGFDVFLQRDGKPILIEVNTNRGEQSNSWSDFIRTPEVLAGYANFFENQYGWHINGVSGRLMRGSLGNLRLHLKHELPYYIELASNAKDDTEKSMILTDLQNTAADYQDRLRAMNPSEKELLNKDYKETVLVIEAFSKVQKSQTLGDAAWNDFAQWVAEFVK